MVIEYVMYFALGFLGAGLLAVAIGPAIWQRAVRLTKRRLEAATPLTLNEFRADKDKLRADFAIATRRLEMRVDALREKLAARVIELDAAASELSALRMERDEQYDAIGALQVREQELMVRIRDLERDGAALAARVRQDEADGIAFAPVTAAADRDPIGADQLSGDYRADVEDLLTALNIERQRNSYLEEQARLLLARLEKRKKGGIKDEAIAMLRDTLAAADDPESEARVELRRAEARISGAESRLNALLSEGEPLEPTQSHAQAEPRRLADTLLDEDQLAELRENVLDVEERVMRNWGSGRFDAASMRARLEAIASDVSQLVYAADAEDSDDLAESLFDRVRKFASDGMETDLPRAAETVSAGPVSERMAALRDMQDH